MSPSILLIAVALGLAPESGVGNCPDVPDEFTPLLAPGAVVVMGEMHGTVEMPARFGDAVCAAAERYDSVIAALELPHELGPVAASRDLPTIRRSAFFQQEYQDGRASAAMAELLDRLFALDNVTVVFFDHRGANRDAKMAAALAAHLDADSPMLALTGNLHSRTEHGAPWDEGRQNMAALLKEQHPNTHSVLFSYADGHAWICSPDCGVTTLTGQPTPDIRFGEADQASKHDWQWHVGAISASPPARTVARQALPYPP